MSEVATSKRARTTTIFSTEKPRNQPKTEVAGREQILIRSHALETTLGKKYINEHELLPLMLNAGLLRRVRTIDVVIRPLGGDSFKVTLDLQKPSVGEAKLEIARVTGTPESRQQLCKVTVRADGQPVREDDATPEFLEDTEQLLGSGAVIAFAVKEEPLCWGTYPEHLVTLSESGAIATCIGSRRDFALITSGVVLTEGRHYWEVELVSDTEDENSNLICIGVTRPNLDPEGVYFSSDSTDGWFVDAATYELNGNGEEGDGVWEECYEEGDRIGVLLDLDVGSLVFFFHGVQHGPGYPAGSVSGPVVHAVQLSNFQDSVQLHTTANWPEGH
jgi:hypothetical protein